jgi:hypothetical protein
MKIIIGAMLTVGLIFVMSMNTLAYNLEIISMPDTGVDPRDTVFFDIVFHPDSGGNLFGDYGFNIYYDNTELTWNPGATTVTPPAPLNVLFQPFENSSGSGMINGISSLAPFSSAGDAILFRPVTLVRLAFSPGSTVQDSAGDIWLDTGSTGTGFTIDGRRVSAAFMPVSYKGTDIHVSSGGVTAPEPAGAVLFVAGMTVIAAAGKAGKDSMQ